MIRTHSNVAAYQRERPHGPPIVPACPHLDELVDLRRRMTKLEQVFAEAYQFADGVIRRAPVRHPVPAPTPPTPEGPALPRGRPFPALPMIRMTVPGLPVTPPPALEPPRVPHRTRVVGDREYDVVWDGRP